MLKKIKITNFLSCQDTEIEFDNITALIGRNAAGKTNILKITYWTFLFILGNKEFLLSLEKETEISMEFIIEDIKFRYSIDKVISGDPRNRGEILSFYKNNQWQIIAKKSDNIATYFYEEKENLLNINPQLSIISSLLTFLPKEKINSAIDNIVNYTKSINYYTLEYNEYFKGSTEYISNKDYQEWISKKTTIDISKVTADSSVRMRLLDLWKQDKELLNELEMIFGNNGLNLIDEIIIHEELVNSPEHHFYYVNFKVENKELNFFQLSYGTKRVLAILLALLYDKNSTLLIEQPEDGIHSGLLKKLLPLCFQYAKYYKKQLIIATHSSEVINLFQPENIRLVKMTDNGTKVLPLDKERMPFIHEFIENEGALFDLIDAMDDE
jgi:AAA15 family ATPase/GTPase